MKDNFDINRISSELIRASNGKIKHSDIENLKKGNTDALFGSLTAKDRENLKRALADKKAANQILNSPEAKKIIESFKKGSNRNG